MPRQPFPAARLAELVRSRGYSVSSGELAEAAGISRVLLHRMCTDEAVNPTWETVCAVLEPLAYTAADLFGDDRPHSRRRRAKAV
jgi:transcriptional regulator with XRE-family HTH domain